mmetsp:Transcript_12623/g.42702  ORF Transcript_12623/g.42702 Transcript_12623/m.42702 type:complete len:281 (+) Transcript_12623:238-1080(+)
MSVAQADIESEPPAPASVPAWLGHQAPPALGRRAPDGRGALRPARARGGHGHPVQDPAVIHVVRVLGLQGLGHLDPLGEDEGAERGLGRGVDHARADGRRVGAEGHEDHGLLAVPGRSAQESKRRRVGRPAAERGAQRAPRAVPQVAVELEALGAHSEHHAVPRPGLEVGEGRRGLRGGREPDCRPRDGSPAAGRGRRLGGHRLLRLPGVALLVRERVGLPRRWRPGPEHAVQQGRVGRDPPGTRRRGAVLSGALVGRVGNLERVREVVGVRAVRVPGVE